jgi:Zn-finger nucleic acid-binding protein
MNCPLCKNAMVVLELQQVEVDHCMTCGGIWLDGGELELLLRGTHQARQFIGSFHREQGVEEKICPCPICLKKMHKIHAGSGSEPVIIDSCPKGHGLWFNKGELSEVLAKGNFDKEQKVIKLLSEIFNWDKSEVKNDSRKR